ncbi:MAG: hypothetical protein UH851_04985, partial [Clostridia bacterium]|nr:hypothetical protein [Clostridia bacterium]
AAQRRESRGTPLVPFFRYLSCGITRKVHPYKHKKGENFPIRYTLANIKKREKLPPFYLKKLSRVFEGS